MQIIILNHMKLDSKFLTNNLTNQIEVYSLFNSNSSKWENIKIWVTLILGVCRMCLIFVSQGDFLTNFKSNSSLSLCLEYIKITPWPILKELRLILQQLKASLSFGLWVRQRFYLSFWVKSWGLEVSLSTTLLFKRSYKISHPPRL